MITTHFQRHLLHITVFITGAAVLIFEVTAVRMLAPYYGSSLSVLSSVLSVILLALSLGYAIGGRIADHRPDIQLLSTLIASGGLTMLGLLYVAKLSLPSLSFTLGASVGPLILASLFFFIPALCLGIDSPFVTKLLIITHQKSEGATVGTVFFWSTIGSIVGSIVGGFILIPNLGLTLTLVLVSLVVIFWSILLTYVFTHKVQITLILFLLCGLILAGLILRIHTKVDGTLVHERDGLYSHIVVYDKVMNGTTYRFLKNDSNFSSAIILGSSTVAFPYTQYALLYRAMVPDPERYLVLGGGSFTIPRHVNIDNPILQVDTVEIEPYLLQIAQTYFDYPTSTQLHNHTMDARVFLQSTSTTYDVIFSDVMNSGLFIPPHLLTKEFFQLIDTHLNENGVAIFNYVGSLDTNKTSMTGSLLRTISSVFPNYRVVAVTNPASKKNRNLLIVVRKNNQLISFGDSTIYHRFTGENFPADSHFVDIEQLSLDDELIFTDDTSASETLMNKQFKLHGT